MKTKICDLFAIDYPIIQGGMVWASGGKLAAACANAGILGLIGAGSMDAELLKSQIAKAKKLTDKPFGVNIPLLYRDVEKQIAISLEAGIRIFFTSAGSPNKYTRMLKQNGCTVVHVCSSPVLAKKCEDAGVDAVVAEGVEAGGHNGREEITTMCLIPQVVDAVKIPVIAAGGIGDGRGVVASLALGALGVQMGTRFVLAQESSAHKNFKAAIIQAGASETSLALRKHLPVRLLKNAFYETISLAESDGASREDLVKLLGKGRARAGIFEGDLETGELEIGQISGLLKRECSAEEIVREVISQARETSQKLSAMLW